MSSSKFDVTINPDRGVHHGVLLLAAACLAAGFLLVARFPLPVVTRALLVCAWGGFCLLESWRYADAWNGIRRLHLAVRGGARLLCANGIWHDAELLPGSVVLRSLVWLRLGTAGRPPAAILLCRRSLPRRDWRRLQALLRLRFQPGFWPHSS